MMQGSERLRRDGAAWWTFGPLIERSETGATRSEERAKASGRSE